MDRLQVAAELCRLSRMPNLAVYLRQEVDAPADRLLGALDVRRRILQGRASNPKYRQEAALVMHHYALLVDVCKDLGPHLEDMADRAEARHFAAIEMMLRGLLATGPLAPSRIARLREGAVSLGVRPAKFDQVVSELMARLRPDEVEEDDEVTEPGSPPEPSPTSLPPAPASPDVWATLGVSPSATPDEIEAAYQLRADEMLPAERQRLDIAYRVLASPSARLRLLASRPGRPVVGQGEEIDEPIQVLGPSIRSLPDRSERIRVRIRTSGDRDLRIESEVAWLEPVPDRLPLTPGVHVVEVRVHRELLPWSARTTTLRLVAPSSVSLLEYRVSHFLFRVARRLAMPWTHPSEDSR
ncbi:MAG: hypothetical protein AAF211_23665 [Myxococcota bacterium]